MQEPSHTWTVPEKRRVLQSRSFLNTPLHPAVYFYSTPICDLSYSLQTQRGAKLNSLFFHFFTWCTCTTNIKYSSHICTNAGSLWSHCGLQIVSVTEDWKKLAVITLLECSPVSMEWEGGTQGISASHPSTDSQLPEMLFSLSVIHSSGLQNSIFIFVVVVMFHTEFKAALIIICTTKKICLSLLNSEDANKDNLPRWKNKENCPKLSPNIPFPARENWTVTEIWNWSS